MKNCKDCKKDISNRGRTAQYCLNCVKRKKKEYSKQYLLKKGHKPRNKPTKVECIYCKKEIIRPICHIRQRVFCSKKCSFNYWKENPPQWLKSRETIKIDTNKFKELYYNNFNDKELATFFNTSISTIVNRRNQIGLKTKHPTSTFTYKEKNNLEKFGIAGELSKINLVRIDKQNTFKHEFCKWIICFILSKKGYKFMTEVKVPGGRIDVYDFTNKNIYEVESVLNKSKKERKFKQLFNPELMNDFFIFDLRKVPNDDKKSFKYFNSRIF